MHEKMLLPQLSLLLLLFGTSFATCKYKFIHNASELIEFSDEVNNGVDYSEYTVYLVNDIIFDEELSKQFEPIGTNGYTIKTFDGQGYLISNLTVVSSNISVALFKNSKGITIRNTILDKSCSVSNSLTSSLVNTFTAGILGACNPVKGPCIIENSVNMASISFSGAIDNYIYMGGIAGTTSIINSLQCKYEAKVTNCVNYGTISNSGSCGTNIIMGGVIGLFYLEINTYSPYLRNCLNYGLVKIQVLQQLLVSVESLVLVTGL